MLSSLNRIYLSIFEQVEADVCLLVSVDSDSDVLVHLDRLVYLDLVTATMAK